MFPHSKIIKTAFALAFFVPAAFADLMIAPTRIVLEKGTRAAELVLINKSNEQGAYRISLENRRMMPDGSLEIAHEQTDAELFAKDFLRYAPRRVMLEANGRQTIRVSANTNALAQGEYRSHLRIMGAPTSAGRTLSEATDAVGNDISIELIAIRSLTIPVIVRVGELGASLEIEGAALRQTDTPEDTIFSARLNRTGNKSTYGDIQIFVEGNKQPVFFARGIAIYTPNTVRDVNLPMPTELANSLRGKTLRIAYVSSDAANPEILSELTTVVN